MPLSLTGRLLCAARQSYQIVGDGPVPAAPNSDQIGYGTPDGFAVGPARIDAALVGEADDGIIVAFRGTLPPDSPTSRIQVGTTAARNAGPYTSGRTIGAATATGTARAAGTHHVRRMAARAWTAAVGPPRRA